EPAVELVVVQHRRFLAQQLQHLVRVIAKVVIEGRQLDALGEAIAGLIAHVEKCRASSMLSPALTPWKKNAQAHPVDGCPRGLVLGSRTGADRATPGAGPGDLRQGHFVSYGRRSTADAGDGWVSRRNPAGRRRAGGGHRETRHGGG